MSIFKEFRRTLHWGPLIALGIINAISYTTVQCSSIWWPASQSFAGFLNVAIFVFSSSMTFYHFFASLALGPGYVPIGWSPSSDKDCESLQFCKTCAGYKAPRSHHCSKCGRCVLKMDHHCPWINNCVGHTNHGHFTAFLFFAVIGCAQSTVVLFGYLMLVIKRPWYPRYGLPVGYVGPWHIFWIVFNLGLAIGVVVAVGILLFLQVRAILRNRTGIEDWILEKANARRTGTGEVFIYPYDLGRKRNWKQVINLMCMPVGDGITWPVREGCNQYTLTVEQLEQKNLKRERSVDYKVVRQFSGTWLPLTHGLKTTCFQPCSEEPRIVISVGDIVTVTRWKKHWYYGEVLPKEGDVNLNSKRLRGWFPKHCVMALDSTPVTKPLSEQKKKN